MGAIVIIGRVEACCGIDFGGEIWWWSGLVFGACDSGCVNACSVVVVLNTVWLEYNQPDVLNPGVSGRGGDTGR